VRGLLQHRCESEKLATARLIDDHLLLVFIDRGHAHCAGQHHVGSAAGLALFIDAFASDEVLQFNLTGQNGGLVVIEQRKKRHAFQQIRTTDHLNLLAAG
jgi:hypothetical protein